jgi:Tol biopolymer transport system component
VAYVSDISGNLDIWLVDVEGHKPIRITDNTGSDSDPTWFPDGKGLAFVSDRTGENAIWKTSTLGGSASLVVADAKSPKISPDGQRLAFVRAGPGGDDRIVVAPLSDPSQATFLTGDEDGLWNHRDPAWSPDGNRICYAAHRNLWIVSLEDGKARPLTVAGQMDFEPVWSPDGKYIYFSSYRTTTALWRVAADGGRPVRVTTGTASEASPSISSDGMRLAYSTSIEDFHLALLDLASGVEQTLKEDCSLQQPAIAPDKKQLLYTADREGMRFDLWLQPLVDGAIRGTPRRLTDHPGQASHPVFSPDGQWVAYYRILDESRDIWIVPSEGGRPIQFTEDPAPDIQPTWSPDGSLLAFVSQRGENGMPAQITEKFQIWVASVFNGRRIGLPSMITQGDISALAPVFSPDGREIAFIGRKGPESDVWIGPVDGSAPPRRITHGAGAERLRWSAAHNALLVSGNWRTSRATLRQVSLDDGTVSDLEPEVVFGFRTIYCNFDISPDGRFLCYMRQEKKGNVWILESEDVSY